MTPFNTIYEIFLNKISDYTLLNLSDDDVKNFCHALLMSSIVKVKPLEAELEKYDDTQKTFNDDLLLIEKEIIACQMVSEWVEPQLNNSLLTRQFIGTNEDKFFAQANQMGAIMTLRDEAMRKSQKLRRNYRYSHNEYLGG